MATEAAIPESISEKKVQDETEDLRCAEIHKQPEYTNKPQEVLKEHSNEPEIKGGETDSAALQSSQMIGQDPPYKAATATSENSTISESSKDQSLHSVNVGKIDNSAGVVFVEAPPRVQIHLEDICNGSNAGIHREDPINKEKKLESGNMLQKDQKDELEEAKDVTVPKNPSSEANFTDAVLYTAAVTNVPLEEKMQRNDFGNDHPVKKSDEHNFESTGANQNTKKADVLGEEKTSIGAHESSVFNKYRDVENLGDKVDNKQLEKSISVVHEMQDLEVNNKAKSETQESTENLTVNPERLPLPDDLGETGLQKEDEENDRVDASEEKILESLDAPEKVSDIQYWKASADASVKELSNMQLSAEESVLEDEMSLDKVKKVSLIEQEPIQSARVIILEMETCKQEMHTEMDPCELSSQMKKEPEESNIIRDSMADKDVECLSLVSTEKSPETIYSSKNIVNEDLDERKQDAQMDASLSTKTEVPGVQNDQVIIMIHKETYGVPYEENSLQANDAMDARDDLKKGENLNGQAKDKSEEDKFEGACRVVEVLDTRETIATAISMDEPHDVPITDISTEDVIQDQETTTYSTDEKENEIQEAEESNYGNIDASASSQLTDEMQSLSEEKAAQKFEEISEVVQNKDHCHEKVLKQDDLKAQTTVYGIPEVSKTQNEEGIQEHEDKNGIDIDKIERVYKHVEAIAETKPSNHIKASEKGHAQEAVSEDAKEHDDESKTVNKRALGPEQIKDETDSAKLANDFIVVSKEVEVTEGIANTGKENIESKSPMNMEKILKEDEAMCGKIEEAAVELMHEYQTIMTNDLSKTGIPIKKNENSEENVGDTPLAHKLEEETVWSCRNIDHIKQKLEPETIEKATKSASTHQSQMTIADTEATDLDSSGDGISMDKTLSALSTTEAFILGNSQKATYPEEAKEKIHEKINENIGHDKHLGRSLEEEAPKDIHQKVEDNRRMEDIILREEQIDETKAGSCSNEEQMEGKELDKGDELKQGKEAYESVVNREICLEENPIVSAPENVQEDKKWENKLEKPSDEISAKIIMAQEHSSNKEDMKEKGSPEEKEESSQGKGEVGATLEQTVDTLETEDPSHKPHCKDEKSSSIIGQNGEAEPTRVKDEARNDSSDDISDTHELVRKYMDDLKGSKHEEDSNSAYEDQIDENTDTKDNKVVDDHEKESQKLEVISVSEDKSRQIALETEATKIENLNADYNLNNMISEMTAMNVDNETGRSMDKEFLEKNITDTSDSHSLAMQKIHDANMEKHESGTSIESEEQIHQTTSNKDNIDTDICKEKDFNRLDFISESVPENQSGESNTPMVDNFADDDKHKTSSIFGQNGEAEPTRVKDEARNNSNVDIFDTHELVGQYISDLECSKHEDVSNSAYDDQIDENTDIKDNKVIDDHEKASQKPEVISVSEDKNQEITLETKATEIENLNADYNLNNMISEMMDMNDNNETAKSMDEEFLEKNIKDTSDSHSLAMQKIHDADGEKHESDTSIEPEEQIHQTTSNRNNIDIDICKEKDSNRLDFISESVLEDQSGESETPKVDNLANDDKFKTFNIIGQNDDAEPTRMKDEAQNDSSVDISDIYELVGQYRSDLEGGKHEDVSNSAYEDQIDENTDIKDNKVVDDHEKASQKPKVISIFEDKNREITLETEATKIENLNADYNLNNMQISKIMDMNGNNEATRLIDEEFLEKNIKNTSDSRSLAMQKIHDADGEKHESDTSTDPEEQIYQTTSNRDNIDIDIGKEKDSNRLDFISESIPKDQSGESDTPKVDNLADDDKLKTSSIIGQNGEAEPTRVKDEARNDSSVDISDTYELVGQYISDLEGSKHEDASNSTYEDQIAENTDIKDNKVVDDHEKASQIPEVISISEDKNLEITLETEATNIENLNADYDLNNMTSSIIGQNGNAEPTRMKDEARNDGSADISDTHELVRQYIGDLEGSKHEDVSISAYEDQFDENTDTKDHKVVDDHEKASQKPEVILISGDKNQEITFETEATKIENLNADYNLNNMIYEMTDMNGNNETAKSMDEEFLEKNIKDTSDSCSLAMQKVHDANGEKHESDTSIEPEEQIHQTTNNRDNIDIDICKEKDSNRLDFISELVPKDQSGQSDTPKVDNLADDDKFKVPFIIQVETSDDDQSHEASCSSKEYIIIKLQSEDNEDANIKDEESTNNKVNDTSVTSTLGSAAASGSLHGDHRESITTQEEAISNMKLDQEAVSDLTSIEQNLEEIIKTDLASIDILEEDVSHAKKKYNLATQYMESEVVNSNEEEYTSQTDGNLHTMPVSAKELRWEIEEKHERYLNYEEQIHESSITNSNMDNDTLEEDKNIKEIERAPVRASEEQSPEATTRTGIIENEILESALSATQNFDKEKTSKITFLSEGNEHCTLLKEAKDIDGAASGTSMQSEGMEAGELSKAHTSDFNRKFESLYPEENQEEETPTRERVSDVCIGTPSNLVSEEPALAARAENMVDLTIEEWKAAQIMDKEVKDSVLAFHENSETAAETKSTQLEPKDDVFTVKQNSVEENMQKDAYWVGSEDHIHDATEDHETSEWVAPENRNKEEMEDRKMLQSKKMEDEKQEERKEIQADMEISEAIYPSECNNESSEEKGTLNKGLEKETLEGVELEKPLNAFNIMEESEFTDRSVPNKEEPELERSFHAKEIKDEKQEEGNKIQSKEKTSEGGRTNKCSKESSEEKEISERGTEKQKPDDVEFENLLNVVTEGLEVAYQTENINSDGQEKEAFDSILQEGLHKKEDKALEDTVIELDPIDHSHEPNNDSDAAEGVLAQEKILKVGNFSAKEENQIKMDSNSSIKSDLVEEIKDAQPSGSHLQKENLEPKALETEEKFEHITIEEEPEKNETLVVGSQNDANEVMQLEEVTNMAFDRLPTAGSIEKTETKITAEDVEAPDVAHVKERRYMPSENNHVKMELSEKIDTTSPLNDEETTKNVEFTSITTASSSGIMQDVTKNLDMESVPKESTQIDTETKVMGIEFANNMMNDEEGSIAIEKCEHISPDSVFVDRTSNINSMTSDANEKGEEAIIDQEDKEKLEEASNSVSNEKVDKWDDSLVAFIEDKDNSQNRPIKQATEVTSSAEEKEMIWQTEGEVHEKVRDFGNTENEENQQTEQDDLPVSRILMDQILQEEGDKLAEACDEKHEDKLQENIHDQQNNVNNSKQERNSVSLSVEQVKDDTSISEGKAEDLIKIEGGSDLVQQSHDLKKDTENAILKDDESPGRNLHDTSPTLTVGEDVKDELSHLLAKELTDLVSYNSIELVLAEEGSPESKANLDELKKLDIITPVPAPEMMTESIIQKDDESLKKSSDVATVIEAFEEDTLKKEGGKESLEISQDIAENDKASYATSEKQTPSVAETVGNAKGEIQVAETVANIQCDQTGKSFQSSSVEDNTLGEALETQSGGTKVETGKENQDGTAVSQMKDVKNNLLEELEVSDSHKVQQSEPIVEPTNETIQAGESFLAKKSPTVSADEKQAKEIADAAMEEEKNQKEEKDKNKTEESGHDAGVVVEAKDAYVKPEHKKSHNILSGVGSKVKHSIAKVRKVITCKSSHSKTISGR